MKELIAHVHNGRLILDEPTDLPEGTKVELEVADPEALDRAMLDAALLQSEADIAAGRMQDGHEVIAELRALRTKS